MILDPDNLIELAAIAAAVRANGSAFG